MTGFGGDPYTAAEVRGLIERWGVRTIVETGTFEGATAAALFEMAPHLAIYTVEADVEKYVIAQQFLHGTSVHVSLGRSQDVLRCILGSEEKPFMCYLDAHWPDSPVLEELAVIARMAPDSVIVIHDVKNPGHPEMGFDTYGDWAMTWENLRDAVEACYWGGAHGCRHYHNSNAGGTGVGVLYVVPVGGPG